MTSHVHAHARAKKRKQGTSSSTGQEQPQESSGASKQAAESLPLIPSRVRQQLNDHLSFRDDLEPALTTASSQAGSEPPTPGDFVDITKATDKHDTGPNKANDEITGFLTNIRRPSTADIWKPLWLRQNGGDLLDPFLVLPMELTKDERNLVHLYVTNFGPAVYGTRKNANFDPSRQVSLPNMLNDELVTKWILIQVESQRARRRGLLETPRSVLARRAQVYRDMNTRLKDSRDLEQVFGSLLAAVISDARDLGPTIANLHLRGISTVVEKRGGMRVLFGDKKVIASFTLYVWAHHHTSTAGGIGDIHELADLKHKFFDDLRNLQGFNQELNAQLGQTGLKFQAHQLDLASARGSRLQGSYLSPLQLYGQVRHRALSMSCLRPLLDPDYPSQTFVDGTCHFSNLFNLNLSLLYFCDDFVAAALFLDKLRRMFEENGTIDPVTGWTSLKQPYMYWVLSVARIETQQAVIPREIYIGQRLIQMLKIRPLLSERSLYTLTRVFSNWLMASGEAQVDFLSEEDLNEMDREIEENYQLPRG